MLYHVVMVLLDIVRRKNHLMHFLLRNEFLMISSVQIEAAWIEHDSLFLLNQPIDALFSWELLCLGKYILHIFLTVSLHNNSMFVGQVSCSLEESLWQTQE